LSAFSFAVLDVFPYDFTSEMKQGLNLEFLRLGKKIQNFEKIALKHSNNNLVNT
jgi:hypothetical protein